MIKKVLKSRIFFFMLGVLLTGGTAFAVSTISDSSEITFNNTGTSISSTNVEGAIKELYEKASSIVGNYSAEWFPEGIPLLPPLDADNYTDYITVDSYSTANLHNGNEVWGPFSNRNLHSEYAASQSGTDYVVRLNQHLYVDKIVCQAGGWTGGYSSYKLFYLDSNGNWNQVYSSGNITTYPAVEIPINDEVYGVKISGYHVLTGSTTPTHPMVISRLQLLRNWS